MNCTEARDAMLVAELSELGTDGPGDSPLAEHLAACAACKRRAGLLLIEMNRLAVRLRRRSRRRVLMVATLPIAAGLVATATMLAKPHAEGVSPTPADPHDGPAKVVTVHVGVGQQAAVIKTADPKTTLIWISSGSH